MRHAQRSASSPWRGCCQGMPFSVPGGRFSFFSADIMYRRRGKPWMLCVIFCRCHLSKRHSHWGMWDTSLSRVLVAFAGGHAGGMGVLPGVLRGVDGVRYVRKIFPSHGEQN